MCSGIRLRNNIALGDLYPDSEIWAALDQCCLTGFAAKLPHGLDEVLRENYSCSGGEAARLNLARAVLRRPKILVADEITANPGRPHGRAHRRDAGRRCMAYSSLQSPTTSAGIWQRGTMQSCIWKTAGWPAAAPRMACRNKTACLAVCRTTGRRLARFKAGPRPRRLTGPVWLQKRRRTTPKHRKPPARPGQNNRRAPEKNTCIRSSFVILYFSVSAAGPTGGDNDNHH